MLKLYHTQKTMKDPQLMATQMTLTEAMLNKRSLTQSIHCMIKYRNREDSSMGLEVRIVAIPSGSGGANNCKGA